MVEDVRLRQEVGPGLGPVQPGQELVLLLQPLSDEEYLGHAESWGSLHCIASRSFSPRRWDSGEMLSVWAPGNYWDQGEQRAANTVCHLWPARGGRHEGRPLWDCLYNCTLTSTGTGDTKMCPSFAQFFLFLPMQMFTFCFFVKAFTKFCNWNKMQLRLVRRGHWPAIWELETELVLQCSVQCTQRHTEHHMSYCFTDNDSKHRWESQHWALSFLKDLF